MHRHESNYARVKLSNHVSDISAGSNNNTKGEIFWFKNKKLYGGSREVLSNTCII